MTRAEFLNVDLDLFGGELAEVIAALEPGAFVLHEERDASPAMATLELDGDPQSLEDAVAGFADLVEKMPASAPASWDGCERRVMNVGIQAGDDPHQATFALSKDALARLVNMHAELLFTVYPR